MMSRILVAVALAACAVQTAIASVARATNDVFVPPVLDPHTGTVWNKDETRTVTWCVLLYRCDSCLGTYTRLLVVIHRDVSNAPQNITNSKGIIILSKGGVATPRTWTSCSHAFARGIGRLCWYTDLAVLAVVLANDFDILLGKIDVKVPWVIPDDDYSVKCE